HHACVVMVRLPPVGGGLDVYGGGLHGSELAIRLGCVSPDIHDCLAGLARRNTFSHEVQSYSVCTVATETCLHPGSRCGVGVYELQIGVVELVYGAATVFTFVDRE